MKASDIAQRRSDYTGDDDLQYYRLVLLALAREYLFSPVTCVARSKGSGSIEKFTVPIISLAGKKYMPAFTSEELFLSWSDGAHQCFPVLGSDLAQTLPEGVGLIINPETELVFEFSPEQVEELAEADTSVPGEDADKGADSEAVEAILANEPAPLADEAVGHKVDNAAEVVGDVSDETPSEELNENGSSSNIKEVEADLIQIVEQYHSVVEAYYFRNETAFSEGVLGLLTDGLNTEDRFRLMAEIADVSRKYYEMAGSIEVYDDLHLDTSKSWELFNSLTPFYVRGVEEEEYKERTPQSISDTLQESSKALETVVAEPKPQAAGKSLFSRLFR